MLCCNFGVNLLLKLMDFAVILRFSLYLLILFSILLYVPFFYSFFVGGANSPLDFFSSCGLDHY
jgi:hypothetical protein